MPMLSLLGGNHCLPLFHMAKRFIWINETKQLINEFRIGYMINTGLNVNKDFREQVKYFMFTTFGVITPPFIKSILLNKNTSVLALITFYETRADEKAYKVLSCVIYTVIKNYVSIDYLDCQPKQIK